MPAILAKTGTAMNANAATWGEADDGSFVNATGTFTPTTSKSWTINELAGVSVDINGTLYTINSNTADDFAITGGPADGSYSYAIFNHAMPVDGDSVHLNGSTVTMNVTDFPATGSFATLDATNIVGANTAGQLQLAMSGTTTYTINAAIFTAGTANLIAITGSASGASVNITGNGTSSTSTNVRVVSCNHTAGNVNTFGNFTAGAAAGTGAHGIMNLSTGTVTHTGNVTGAAVAGNHGAVNNSTGSFTLVGNALAGSGAGFVNNSTGTWSVTGNATGSASQAAVYLVGNGSGSINSGTITAGSAASTCGLRNDGTGTATINNCNIVHSTSCEAVRGKHRYNPGAGNYTQYAKTSGTVNQYALAADFGLTAGVLKASTVVGEITGTRADCPTGSALVGTSYGDPTDPLIGTAPLDNNPNIIGGGFW